MKYLNLLFALLTLMSLKKEKLDIIKYCDKISNGDKTLRLDCVYDKYGKYLSKEELQGII